MIKLLAGQRQRNETGRAVQACNDYLRMGPGRSLRDLWRQYNESKQKQTPTLSWGTLAGWSSRYQWAERAEAYDTQLEQQKNQRRDEIMASGLALAHERVEKLKWLADFLEGQIKEQGEDGVYHNVWLPDVKQIGSGKDAERVDIERFNSAIISEYRATLDDLAKETGGRIHRQELSGQDGGPIAVRLEDVLDALPGGLGEAVRRELGEHLSESRD